MDFVSDPSTCWENRLGGRTPGLHFVNRNPGIKVAVFSRPAHTKQSLGRFAHALFVRLRDHQEGPATAAPLLFVTPQGRSASMKLAYCRPTDYPRAFRLGRAPHEVGAFLAAW